MERGVSRRPLRAPPPVGGHGEHAGVFLTQRHLDTSPPVTPTGLYVIATSWGAAEVRPWDEAGKKPKVTFGVNCSWRRQTGRVGEDGEGKRRR